MNYYIGDIPFCPTDELQHHGILGQKWGVRRYQNKDGSYTAEGKARYYNSDGSWTRKGRKQAGRDAKSLLRTARSRMPGKQGRIEAKANEYSNRYSEVDVEQIKTDGLYKKAKVKIANEAGESVDVEGRKKLNIGLSNTSVHKNAEETKRIDESSETKINDFKKMISTYSESGDDEKSIDKASEEAFNQSLEYAKKHGLSDKTANDNAWTISVMANHMNDGVKPGKGDYKLVEELVKKATGVDVDGKEFLKELSDAHKQTITKDSNDEYDKQRTYKNIDDLNREIYEFEKKHKNENVPDDPTPEQIKYFVGLSKKLGKMYERLDDEKDKAREKYGDESIFERVSVNDVGTDSSGYSEWYYNASSDSKRKAEQISKGYHSSSGRYPFESGSSGKSSLYKAMDKLEQGYSLSTSEINKIDKQLKQEGIDIPALVLLSMMKGD